MHNNPFKRLPIILGFIFCFSHSLALAQTSTNPISTDQCVEFTFDATGSYDPDNKDITFLWEFGDGQVSHKPVVTHTYKQSGDYKVTLAVTDATKLTAMTTQHVRANFPPHIVLNAPRFACTSQSIHFDASKSSDDSGRPLVYSWNFGDGTKATTSTVHKGYAEGGDYLVKLSVDDNYNTKCSERWKEHPIHINQAPVAEIGQDKIQRCIDGYDDMLIAFDGSQSYDANNDPLTYIWDFGDGEQKQGVSVRHQYKNIGVYDAKLIVKDGTEYNCGTDIDFVSVQINKNPTAVAGEDTKSCPKDLVTFDGSQSKGDAKGTLGAKWDFGDGNTSNQLSSQHRYERPGQYNATLAVTNLLNPKCKVSTDTKKVTVNATPVANLKSVTKSCVGESVTFDASTSFDPDGDSLEYYWDFGDGSIVKGGAKINHKYAKGGTYRVSVVVDDGHGLVCSSATTETTININTPPLADVGVNRPCCVDKVSTFDASGSQDPDHDALTYTWDFGDGAIQQGEKVEHIYKKSGTYTITLTANDGAETACSESKISYTANINILPVPVIKIR